jgi:sulfoxide reductase catalytic subunit YedY
MHFLKDRGFQPPRAVRDHAARGVRTRRAWLRRVSLLAAGGGLGGWAARDALAQAGQAARPAGRAQRGVRRRDDGQGHALRNDATTYNNFYEFGTDKADPARNAGTLKTRPGRWPVEGEVKKPRQLRPRRAAEAGADGRAHLPAALRRRLVDGHPLGGLVAVRTDQAVEPTGNAKFVQFVTLADKAQMPGLRSSVLDWPYVEGLRMDEALHPLTMLAFGMYGEVLPNQNGAPVRLVVPWKYGFKSGKSIVKIRFVDKQPKTSWEEANSSEYGFYSNVNPASGPPALEPGHRAPHRRRRPVRQEAADADVQRLRAAGGPALRRHGPEEVLLTGT